MILDRDPTEDLKKAFKLFAEDSNGKISFRNLRKIAKLEKYFILFYFISYKEANNKKFEFFVFFLIVCECVCVCLFSDVLL